MTSALAILSALLAIVRAVADWMHDRKLIDQGTQNALYVHTTAALAAITRAQDARQLVRDRHARDPSSIVHDDGFKRPD